jgi:energy-coupling factor transporter ATP-binding protein EcfA2
MARVLKKSWHEAFFECHAPHTDAPDSFVLWAAISLIGAALKNNVYFDLQTYTLYPNEYIILTGPPGVGKGTVMGMIEGMVKDCLPNKVVNTLTDRVTAERIIELIADGWALPPRLVNQQVVIGAVDHNCLLFSQEIRVLLGASPWMLTFLEEAWSRTNFSYQTKNKGNVVIDDMCCSLLAASVPEVLRNVHREANMVITGGFSSRCLFIYADHPSKSLDLDSVPMKKSKPSKELYDKLCLDLQDISKLRGEFTVEVGAKLMFADYVNRSLAAAAADDNEAIANFRGRMKAHILKLAIVFSVSRSNSLVISVIDMANALSEISKITVSLNKLFRGAGEGMDAATTARVQDFIEKNGRVSKREILKALYRHINSAETLDRILHILETIQFCKKVSQGKGIDYWQHTPPPKKP